MGDGFDYDVWYKGMVIGNVKAFTDEEAHTLANKRYTQPVTVTRT